MKTDISMMVLESSAAGGGGDGEGDVEGDDGALAASFGVNAPTHSPEEGRKAKFRK